VRHVASVALLRRHARGAHVETALAWAGPRARARCGLAAARRPARAGRPRADRRDAACPDRSAGGIGACRSTRGRLGHRPQRCCR
jgi:hypothetical protein